MNQPAVVLLSGGIDSTTLAAHLIAAGHPVHAVTVNYGQRHRRELHAAEQVATRLGVATHRTVVIRADFGGGPLTNPAADLPSRDYTTVGADPNPETYVPARNTVLLSLALARAETVNAHNIYLGATAEDQTGYPDCRPTYLHAWSTMAGLGTRLGTVTAHAPFAAMTKADVIRHAVALGVDLALTWSCYNPPADRPSPCRRCDACIVRAAGFATAGIDDPAVTA